MPSRALTIGLLTTPTALLAGDAWLTRAPATLWAVVVIAAVAALWGISRSRQLGPRPEPAASPPEEMRPDPTETTFKIGNAALPHLRQGLNRDTAQHIADIIQRTAGVDAVAITDTQMVLGWAGKPCPQHAPGTLLSATTRAVLRDQVNRTLDTKHLAGAYEECDLGTVVIAPLVSHHQSVGCIKLYVSTDRSLSQRIVAHAEGIAQLLSILLELAEADRQKSLAADARLEALQAQIRPHFLFNVLNTIISFSRTDPDKTRELLIQLATFFRRSLAHRGPTILLKDEIEYVQTYLNLEVARYSDRLRYRIRIDPSALDVPVPILMLQPLIENAVVHGIAPKEHAGLVSLTVRRQKGTPAGDANGQLVIYISDSGTGIPKSKQYEIFEMGSGTGMGLGLSNVSERLVGLYGPSHHLRLRSREGHGTTIRLVVPCGSPAPLLPARSTGN
ncbi:MAG: histidine kinase [Thermaerobacter sp.]|nr:histidine kinase [Thermaerobacter sp.]